MAVGNKVCLHSDNGGSTLQQALVSFEQSERTITDNND